MVLNNLALGKTATANYGQDTAYKVTDGVVSTKSYWASMDGSSNAPVEDSWIMVDLENVSSLEKIIVYPYWGNRYYHYDVYTSIDGKNWTLRAEQRSTEYGTSAGHTSTFDTPIIARYIKIQGVATYVENRSDINNFHIVEIEAYGTELSEEQTAARSALEQYVSSLNYRDDDYTPATWSAYSEALDMALSLLDNGNASVSDYEAALTALQDAADSLEKTANKILLAATVTQALVLKEEGALEGVNELVVSEFESALAEAQSILDDVNATQSETDASWMRLSTAIQMLSFTSDKTELNLLIAACEAMDLDDYKDGYAKDEFVAALTYAREVQADPAALDDESIAAAIARLQAARDALLAEANLDTSILEILVSYVQDVDLSLYITDGQAEFTEALAAGQAVLADPKSQQEIDSAALELNQAWLNLRLKADESLLAKLQELKASLSALNRSLYSSENAARITAALLEVQEALANSDNLDTATASSLIEMAEEVLALETESADSITESLTSDENLEDTISITSADDLAASISSKTTTSSTDDSISASTTSSTSKSASTGVQALPFAALGALSAGLFLMLKKRRSE